MTDPDTYDHIAVRPVGAGIGAELTGPELGADLDPAVVAEIRAALLAHRVVFIRGQFELSAGGQRAFAERLGPLTEADWPSDATFVDRIPAISVLRARELPAYGGTTVWADTVAAYAGLHPGLRALCDALRAIHTDGDSFETEHPVVRIHPETGERALLLGRFLSAFVDLSAADSRALLELLQRHVLRLENTVRWSWRAGDVAIWDHRATQHHGVADPGDRPHLMHRLTVAGDVPVGPDGRPSVPRAGDASPFSVIAEPLMVA